MRSASSTEMGRSEARRSASEPPSQYAIVKYGAPSGCYAAIDQVRNVSAEVTPESAAPRESGAAGGRRRTLPPRRSFSAIRAGVCEGGAGKANRDAAPDRRRLSRPDRAHVRSDRIRSAPECGVSIGMSPVSEISLCSSHPSSIDSASRPGGSDRNDWPRSCARRSRSTSAARRASPTHARCTNSARRFGSSSSTQSNTASVRRKRSGVSGSA